MCHYDPYCLLLSSLLILLQGSSQEQVQSGPTFGSIANTFSIGSGNQPGLPEDFNFVQDHGGPAGADDGASLCIIDSWTVPGASVDQQGGPDEASTDGGATADAGFINAGTITQEEFDNFFPSIGGGGGGGDSTVSAATSNQQGNFHTSFDPFQHQ